MSHIKSVDEAHNLARSLCQQHITSLSRIVSEEQAKIAATKKIANELQRKLGEYQQKVLNRKSSRTDLGMALTSSLDGTTRGVLKQQVSGASGKRHETSKERAYRRWRTTFRQLATVGKFVSMARLQKKNTCAEEFSVTLDDFETPKERANRFYKDSGKRHETPEERAYRRWRTTFRQLATVGKFVSMARLQKKNTCAEEFSVSLDDF